MGLLQFAGSGRATAHLDIEDESVQRYRYFYAGNERRGLPDRLVEGRTFAKYIYKWGAEYFVIYIVQMGYQQLQYILKEPAEGETTMSSNGVTDSLIATVGEWQKPADYKFIYVYDTGFWQESRDLYEQVRTSEWKDVILNEDMKKTITELMHKFFDSEDIYKDLGVPWKRGVIFHGPAGNGKTISIKALMNSLFKKYEDSIPSLYVKSAPNVWDIRKIFQLARYQAPCLLIFEDIDTIVTQNSRSYFFNEVDVRTHLAILLTHVLTCVIQGLENNDGIFMVASTNHLDQLDPGLSSRPSRFDRKYLFPLPSEAERVMYCDYWLVMISHIFLCWIYCLDCKTCCGSRSLRTLVALLKPCPSRDMLTPHSLRRENKLKDKPSIRFPRKLSPAIAGITYDFSFAYLKEAFVSTVLAIARNRSENGIRGGGDEDGGDLDDYELWREMKTQVRLLRDDMDSSGVKKYHTREPLDLALQSPENATTAPAGSAFSTLPSRPGSNPAARILNHPRNMNLDRDFNHAPLIDNGMFLDCRFDGIDIARMV